LGRCTSPSRGERSRKSCLPVRGAPSTPNPPTRLVSNRVIPSSGTPWMASGTPLAGISASSAGPSAYPATVLIKCVAFATFVLCNAPRPWHLLVRQTHQPYRTRAHPCSGFPPTLYISTSSTLTTPTSDFGFLRPKTSGSVPYFSTSLKATLSTSFAFANPGSSLVTDMLGQCTQ
jgi:hypothetical protein